MSPKKTNGIKFKPTDDERKLVEQMCAVGIPQESISLVIRDGIDGKTLRKHFRSELDTAAVKANAMVGGTLYEKAVGGDITAAIWWTKTRMRWKDTSRIEHAGDPDAPISMDINVNFVKPNKEHGK